MDITLVVVAYLFTFVLGLCLGSFATALIYRIPRDISWITNSSATGTGAAHSACTSCNTRLRSLDLIPVFSWLFFGGKCRHCAAPISSYYPIIEILTALSAIALLWSWGMAWPVVPLIFSLPFLIAAVVIDWEHMILPDDINVALSILSLIFVGLLWQENGYDTEFLLSRLFSAALLFAILFSVSFVVSKWKGRDALGWGDFKFLPAAGLFLGVAPLPSFMALSGILGIVTAILKGGIEQKKPFPFGPALIISLYIHVFLTGLGFDYTW